MLSLPDSSALRAPVHVDLNITNGCDLQCAHCHSSSGGRAPGELSTRELLVVGREVHGVGATSLVVAGGEPFIRHGVVELLGELCSLPGWSVAVVTNGQALASDRAARRLASACPALLVNVSLDGHTPSLNGILRRKRSLPEITLFEQTCAAISALADLGLAVSINTTITRRTIDHLPALCGLADELGAIGVVAIKFLPVGFGKDAAAQLDLDFSSWSRSLVALTERKAAGELPSLSLSVAAPWEFDLPHIAADWDLVDAMRVWGRAAAPTLRSTGVHGDPAGAGTLAIDATGAVYPSILCLGSAPARCGNVQNAPIHEIWRESVTLARLRELRVSQASASCAACELGVRCGGGSRGRALALTGSLYGPDIACPLEDSHGAAARGPEVRLLGYPSRRLRLSTDVGAAPRTHAVFGAGRTAVRLIEYPNGWELRTTWAIREVAPEDVTPLLEHASRPRSPTPTCLREIADLPREPTKGALADG